MSSNHRLITLTDPASAISEAYRNLRINLQFASLDTGLATLLLTSPGPGEGKSTTLANLAVTMAQVDQRVIIVDADLRRPYLHSIFQRPNDVGLTTMMLDEQALAEPPLQDTEVPGLALLTSGTLPPRPADLLGSRRMEAAIASLTERADVVIFDAPPVLVATDAVVLSTKVNGVLLVVSAGQTKRQHAREAVERLRRVNANLVGAVLNNAPMEAVSSYYG